MTDGDRAPMSGGLFEKRAGPLFAIAQRDDRTWALYFCDATGAPHAYPLAYVVESPDGWEIGIAENVRWLPVPETLTMLRCNGLVASNSGRSDS